MPIENEIIVPKYISGIYQETVLTPNEINAYSNNNPSGFITGVNLSSYATIVNLNDVSGNLQTQIDNISGGGGSGVTGDYYPNSNPSGFITGVDLSAYAQIQQLNDLQPDEGGIIVSYAGGLWDSVPDNLGFNIQDGDLIIYRNGSPIAGITPQDLTSNRNYILPNSNGTIALLINANPIFAPNLVYNTGQQSISGTKNFATRPQVNNIGVLISGEAYPSNNPSGYITGVNLSSYATIANLASTGNNLQNQINSLSGSAVLIYGNQTIDGTKTFRNSVYIHDLYVTGTEFIANVQNNFIESPYILLNLTGGAVDGGIFFVTGTGLTGVNDYGPIIGFDHSNKFKFGFARRSDDLSVLNDIAAVQDLTNYSGFANNNYYRINNPSGFITGIDTSNFYTNNNPSGFITNANVVFTTGNQSIRGINTFISGLTINIQPTGTNPGLSLTGNWNNTGQVYTGIFFNVINSGSSSNSRLLDLQTDNISRFNILSNGSVSMAGSLTLGNFQSINLGINGVGSAPGGWSANGDSAIWGGHVVIGPAGRLHWRTAQWNINSYDLALERDNSGILAQRNGINPQQFRVYNITGTNTGEFGVFGWVRTGVTGTPNALVIGTQATQSGTLRDVIITGNNININGAGTFNIFDNTNLIGDLNVSGNITISGNPVITTAQTGEFYPRNNPSGFITGVNLSGYVTTGYLNQVSGNLQSQIDVLSVNSIAYAIALG